MFFNKVKSSIQGRFNIILHFNPNKNFIDFYFLIMVSLIFGFLEVCEENFYLILAEISIV